MGRAKGPVLAATAAADSELTPSIDWGVALFEVLRRETRDGPGVTRAAYGRGEQLAHAIVKDAATQLGLESANDVAGNLYATLPGRDRAARRLVIGSHLDSVPRGGNYDGAAGVVAGLCAIDCLKRAGVVPSCDMTVMATRAEEGVWFPYSYVGSRMALGQLSSPLLDTLKRSDTGRSLASHIDEMGFDSAAVRRGTGFLSAQSVAAFIEPHIEQGPVLEAMGLPLGIVTGIRGNFRYRRANCLGAYGHSGAVPRILRRDAVSAVADLVVRMNAIWEGAEKAGDDLSVTFGRFSTDARAHGFSTIAGAVEFAVDVRSQAPAVLQRMKERLLEEIQALERRRNVTFELEDYSDTPPGAMDPGLRSALMESARRQGVAFAEIASGAGHDAACFANAGIPTAMLFIRNSNGSHNPDETMSTSDFGTAVAVLTDFLKGFSDSQ